MKKLLRHTRLATPQLLHFQKNIKEYKNNECVARKQPICLVLAVIYTTKNVILRGILTEYVIITYQTTSHDASHTVPLRTTVIVTISIRNQLEISVN